MENAFLGILEFNLKLQFCISSNSVIIRDNPTKSIGCVGGLAKACIFKRSIFYWNVCKIRQ